MDEAINGYADKIEIVLNADGSVTVPEALRPYMGGKDKIISK